MTANLDSVFFVSKPVAQRMIQRGKGSIINICSVMSELARPTTAPYAATKGGLKMLTKGMATDWGKHGVRVNGIGPGYFKTELNDALVKDEKFSSWVAGRTPLARWGDRGRTGGGRGVPGVGRSQLRHRACALCRRRDDGLRLTGPSIDPTRAKLTIR